MADDEERLAAAESLAKRLDRPMGILGIIFLLVVLAQLLVTDPTGQTVLSVINWIFWGIFVAEFLLRAYVARFQASFWRKKLVADYLSGDAILTVLPGATGPADLTRHTLWVSALGGSSRDTFRREVALE